jgi:Fic-DOC domain mobile mystery protein B
MVRKLIMQFLYPNGATPLDPDEAAGLLPSHISLQAYLNDWEKTNISQGEEWASRQKKRDLLQEGFVRDLHRKMFDRTWQWAGKFRQSNKNLGVYWTQISVKLRVLLDNTRYWIDHNVFEADETVVRFHHQLVWIHPFPNGNGRHARMMADHLSMQLGRPRLSWGSASLETIGSTRAKYLAALRAADQSEYRDLIEFARS